LKCSKRISLLSKKEEEKIIKEKEEVFSGVIEVANFSFLSLILTLDIYFPFAKQRYAICNFTTSIIFA
jgi:hypothetical protein